MLGLDCYRVLVLLIHVAKLHQRTILLDSSWFWKWSLHFFSVSIILLSSFLLRILYDAQSCFHDLLVVGETLEGGSFVCDLTWPGQVWHLCHWVRYWLQDFMLRCLQAVKILLSYDEVNNLVFGLAFDTLLGLVFIKGSRLMMLLWIGDFTAYFSYRSARWELFYVGR